VTAGEHVRRLDWLAVFLTAWVLPLAYEAWRPLTYATSLLFWLVPTALLWPRFARLTDAGGRRRTAFALASLQIVVLGIVLDFVFGRWVLSFDDRQPTPYLHWIDIGWLRAHIPIEEVLFYILAPIAILLVYVWCDEYFLAAYNQANLRLERARQQLPLVESSWSIPVLAVAIVVAGVAVKNVYFRQSGWPVYLTFLTVVAFVPATLLFRRVSDLVNWRAFSVTFLYLLVTSIVWEAFLALQRGWWWYQEPAMVGVWLDSLTNEPMRRLPLEAVLVWIAAPFSCVLTYEAVKAWQYQRRPDKPIHRG
jgi:hypothetical protein